MRSFIALAAIAAVAACGAEHDAPSLGLSQSALIGTVGFDDAPSGTAIDVRYPGVSFKEELTGGHVYAVALGSGPGNLVSIWSPLNRAGVYSTAFAAEEGAVRATFSKLQRTVSVRARLVFPAEYLTAPKRPYLQAFDAQGNYLATTYYDPAAGCAGAACQWQTLAITRATADIKSVRLSSQNNFSGLTGCLVPDTACSAIGTSGCPNRVYGGFYGQFDDLTFDNGGAALAAAYRGCYTDDANRALPVRLIDSGATVESCVATAAARGFPYAALQWYGQCWAGYTLGYAKTAESECNTPCSANAGETCGGSWRSSVYETSAAARLPAVSAYQGCFVDSSARALPAQLFTSGATVESCVAAAAARGFAYAGLQAGGQCFAGNALAYGKTAECDCNTTCSTARGEICGGAWRNSLCATGAAATALPPVASLSMGCYSDDANRALPAQLIAKGATVETCIARPGPWAIGTPGCSGMASATPETRSRTRRSPRRIATRRATPRLGRRAAAPGSTACTPRRNGALSQPRLPRAVSARRRRLGPRRGRPCASGRRARLRLPSPQEAGKLQRAARTSKGPEFPPLQSAATW